MDRNRVVFVEKRAARAIVPHLDHFKFSPKTHWPGWRGRLHSWALHKAWEFLRYYGAMQQATLTETTYTRHVIDPQDALDRIFKQRRALFMMNQTPREVLIGSDDFAELMHAPRIEQYMEFNAQLLTTSAADRDRGWHDREERIFGLKIRVVPWMIGTVVMP